MQQKLHWNTLFKRLKHVSLQLTWIYIIRYQQGDISWHEISNTIDSISSHLQIPRKEVHYRANFRQQIIILIESMFFFYIFSHNITINSISKYTPSMTSLLKPENIILCRLNKKFQRLYKVFHDPPPPDMLLL